MPCSPKSTSKPCWLMGSLPTRFGWLGIRGLLSELSIPWNREQTDSLTQGIIEAGPRYQFLLDRLESVSSDTPQGGF